MGREDASDVAGTDDTDTRVCFPSRPLRSRVETPIAQVKLDPLLIMAGAEKKGQQ